jgi:AcrR family transcriptional regulator
VIDMGFLSVIRSWALRDKMPIREIARRTGLSHNTIKKYLREGAVEPKFKTPRRPPGTGPEHIDGTLERLLAQLALHQSGQPIMAFAEVYRIRDKVAASRKKGMWMGGYVPLGYDVVDRKLIANENEAAQVRRIFERFVELGAATMLARELRHERARNKQGTLIDKGYLYRLLKNRVYRGEAVHKGKAYPGEHDAIIDEALWDRAHTILQESPRKRASNTRAQTPALLKGLIFSETGAAMTPTTTKKGAKLYRYYVSMDMIRNRNTADETAPTRLAAGMVEEAVVTEIRRMLQTPEAVTQVLSALKTNTADISEADALGALHEFDTLWTQLFPAEQAQIVQLLVRRITVTAAGLEVDIRRAGIAGVIREMFATREIEAAD